MTRRTRRWRERRIGEGLAMLLATVLPLAPLVSHGSAAAPVRDGAGDCTGLGTPEVPGARVVSVDSAIRPGGTFTFPPRPPTPTPPPVEGVPPYCQVTVVLTHPGVGDRVRTDVWLPLAGWNGRFQGTGGAGFAAGQFERMLAPAVKAGYAAASTDAGVGTDGLSASAWALDAAGEVHEGLLTNFASRSLHEMSLVGEQVTEEVYGRPAAWSYWNGCSTGGRQGLMEAQRHPGDFDGILAAAPAINWDRFTLAELWPHVVMHEEDTYPSGCELAAFHQAAVAVCDPDDGVADGVVTRPWACSLDPETLVGRTLPCGEGTAVISREDARVVRRIWEGPTTPEGERLWYGLAKGAPFDVLAATTTASDGSRHGVPFPVGDEWLRYFLERRPEFDTSRIGPRQLERYFRQSHQAYNTVIGTDDPDLSAFRDAGGRMITWHGLADRLIFAQGTVDYRRRVEERMGGRAAVDEFYRVFLAPGADHCGGGPGPVPTDPLAALVDWVEHGRAPDVLPAATTAVAGGVVTRDVCRYPLVSRYAGSGDPADAAAYRCVDPGGEGFAGPIRAPAPGGAPTRR